MKRLLPCLALGFSLSAVAGPREQARRIHDRLAGVPPTEAVLSQMASLIEQGDAKAAARIAMENENFLRVTLKNMAAGWTNVDESIDVPLNDYTATVIGMIRDDVAFDQVLYGDLLYVGAAGLANLDPYAIDNNNHYQQFEDAGYSYSTGLVSVTQSASSDLGVSAGVLTTRGFGAAYYSAGTNRRAVRFTAMTFLCRDMEQLSDPTRSDLFVRKDVSRSPGGDPLAYRNTCSGCHAGMDPLSKAFANIDFVDSAVEYTPGTVVEKVNRNSNVFPQGYETTDDVWRNLWGEGQNASLGWSGEMTGSGMASYGQMLSRSKAFDECMAERVFTKVCLHSPDSANDRLAIESLGKKFKDSGYIMKELFAETATLCLVK